MPQARKSTQPPKQEITCPEFLRDSKSGKSYRRGEVLGKGGFEILYCFYIIHHSYIYNYIALQKFLNLLTQQLLKLTLEKLFLNQS